MGNISAGWGSWLLVVALASSMPRPGFGNSNVRLANLTQDIELLSRQVAILRSEVEALRRENAQLKTTIVAGAASGNVSRESLRSFVEAMDRKFDAFRQEIAGGNATHKKELLKEINGKLTELARQTKVQVDALAKALSVPRRLTTPAPPDVDHPKTGIVYKVEKGDTLSGIARENESKVLWIKAANGIAVDTALQAGRDIFVPQEN